MTDWKMSRPPNEEIVEVEKDGEIIRVMAFYGRDGYLPHWRTENDDCEWSMNAFKRWRRVELCLTGRYRSGERKYMRP